MPWTTGHSLGAFVDVDGLHNAQREHCVVVITVRHHRVHRYTSWHIESWDMHTVWLIIGFAQCPATMALTIGIGTARKDALHAGQHASTKRCTALTDEATKCR